MAGAAITVWAWRRRVLRRAALAWHIGLIMAAFTLSCSRGPPVMTTGMSGVTLFHAPSRGVYGARAYNHGGCRGYVSCLGGRPVKRVLVLILGLMIMFGGVAACSSSGKSATAVTSASQSASAANASCAQAGTRKIPKTRLLADLGLTYGAFQRYLYKPFKAGAFQKGANGRTKALIKAGLASAAIVKLLSNASKNAAADPTLCKYVPNIDNIKNSLSNLTGKVKNGSASPNEVDGTNNMFSQLQNGSGFSLPTSASLPGLS